MHPEQSAIATLDRYHFSYLCVSIDAEVCIVALFFHLATRLNLSLGKEVSYVDNDGQDKVQHGCKRGMISRWVMFGDIKVESGGGKRKEGEKMGIKKKPMSALASQHSQRE